MPASGRYRYQFRQLTEVLGNRREDKLVMRTIRSTYSEPVEFENALEVGEQHLGLLAKSAKGESLEGPCDLAGR